MSDGLHQLRVIGPHGYIAVLPSENVAKLTFSINGLSCVGFGPVSIRQVIDAAEMEMSKHGRTTKVVQVTPEDLEAMLEEAKRLVPRTAPPPLPVCSGCPECAGGPVETENGGGI